MIAENTAAALIEQLDSVPGEEEDQDCEKDDVHIDEEKDKKVAASGIQILHGFISAPEEEDQTDEEQDHDNGGPPASIIPEFERPELHSRLLLNKRNPAAPMVSPG